MDKKVYDEARVAAQLAVRRELAPVQQLGQTGVQREAGDERLGYGRWLVAPGGAGGGGGYWEPAVSNSAFFAFPPLQDSTQEEGQPEVDGFSVGIRGGSVRAGTKRVNVGQITQLHTLFFPTAEGFPKMVWVEVTVGPGSVVTAGAIAMTAKLEQGSSFPEQSVTGYTDGLPTVKLIFPLITVTWHDDYDPEQPFNMTQIWRHHIGGDLDIGPIMNEVLQPVLSVRYNPDESRVEQLRRKLFIVGGLVVLGEDLGAEGWLPIENGSVGPCPSES